MKEQIVYPLSDRELWIVYLCKLTVVIAFGAMVLTAVSCGNG